MIDGYNPGKEVIWDVDKSSSTGCEQDDMIELPPLGEEAERECLVAETKSDKSLTLWRKLGSEGKKGFVWKDNLLYVTQCDSVFQPVQVLVLRASHRKKDMQLAHEGAGHLLFRKVMQMLKRRFLCPRLAADVENHCKSCITCQRCSKALLRRAPKVERPIITEPFEQVAFDIVGPFPKAKGGYRHVLTYIPMGSKWPEAIPLKSITAKAVAEGMVGVFSRTGLPLQILADQGAQFTGALMKELWAWKGSERRPTTPRLMESSNECSSLTGMLNKAHNLGMDWAQQLPYALLALRQMPNRDTGL